MAFEETIRLVKETQKNSVATEEGVEKAKAAYEAIRRDISNAQARLRRKLGNEHAEVVARQVIKILQSGNVLEATLIDEITSAALGSEFERDVYLSKLYQVAGDREIYKLFLVDSGWNSRIATQIVFEEAGGRLVDYARGIRAYRASLKTKVGQAGGNRGLKATSWWLAHVYGTTLEDSTVDGRVGSSGRPAPFWQLLDAGSTRLPSDRPDGSFNPLPQPPTGFINKSELRINKEFDTLFARARAIELEDADRLKAEIQEATEVRESILEDVQLLTTDYIRNQKILQQLGAKAQYADENKLAKIMRRIDEDEPNLPKRVEIGVAGHKMTISVKKLQGYDL